MRGEYDKRGLRWACDYDCMRVKCGDYGVIPDHTERYYINEIRFLEYPYLLQ